MNDVILRARNLNKSYSLLKSERSVLRALKATLKRSPLRKAYPVLEDISFEIRRGERLALLGGNGAGKSTFLRLICGILSPSSGELDVRTPSSGVFSGDVGLLPELSVIDNIDLLGAIHQIPPKIIADKRAEILAMADLTDLPYARAKELSVGQRRRLALSVFFHTDHELVILDEALSYVDASFAKKCEDQFMTWARKGKTFIVVSHDVDFIRRLCDRAIWLQDRRVELIGPMGEVADAYALAQAKKAAASEAGG